MSEKENATISKWREFFKTYPRLIPVVVAVFVFAGCLTGMYFIGRHSVETRTEAEIAYDDQVWKTKTAKEQAISEDLEKKFLTERAQAEKDAAQIRLEAAELEAKAIATKADAEAKANAAVADSLTPDLMQYFEYRIALLNEKKGETNEEATGIQ